MSNKIPRVGDTVIFQPNPDDSVARSNGNHECAAIITRVWGPGVVNLKIIPDHGPMQDRGSVAHQSMNAAGCYCWRYPQEDRLDGHSNWAAEEQARQQWRNSNSGPELNISNYLLDEIEKGLRGETN